MSFKNFRISIIGAGNLGCTLARYFHQKQNSPLSIISKSHEELEKIAFETRAVTYGNKVDQIHRESNIIFITVPDSEIKSVVKKLTQVLFFDWENVLVIHCSGAMTSEILAPLEHLGAKIGSIHPIQTFPSKNEAVTRFQEIYWGVEAKDETFELAKKIVKYMNGIPVHISQTAKPIYHIACVMASNYQVTLMNLAGEALSSCGLSREDTFEILSPLVYGTMNNMDHNSLESSLTGPISRGDLETVEKHIQELKYQLPHLLPIYSALALETVRVAVRKGTLDSHKAAKFNAFLQSTLMDSFKQNDDE